MKNKTLLEMAKEALDVPDPQLFDTILKAKAITDELSNLSSDWFDNIIAQCKKEKRKRIKELIQKRE